MFYKKILKKGFGNEGILKKKFRSIFNCEAILDEKDGIWRFFYGNRLL